MTTPLLAGVAQWAGQWAKQQVGGLSREAAEDLTVPGNLARALAIKAAFATAAGVGLVIGTGTAAWAGLELQAKRAAERIGLSEEPPPLQDGLYRQDGSYLAPVAASRSELALAFRVCMLGDSTSAGFGATDPDGLPGVMLAQGLAAEIGRSVQLFTHAVVGSGAADLARQVDEALANRPHLVVIIVGPNDVRARVSPVVSAGELEAAVTSLRDRDITVVVGTCPDLSVIAPIPQPLRRLAGHWSRTLANKQEQAVRRAGGIAVPVGRIVSPEFRGHPDMFAADLFHPSGAGYARAIAVLLPAALDALDVQPLHLLEPNAERIG